MLDLELWVVAAELAADTADAAWRYPDPEMDRIAQLSREIADVIYRDLPTSFVFPALFELGIVQSERGLLANPSDWLKSLTGGSLGRADTLYKALRTKLLDDDSCPFHRQRLRTVPNGRPATACRGDGSPS